MRSTLLVHILAGGLGLVAGFVALYAPKGGPLHRKSGMLFVYAMLAMAAGGLVLTVMRDVALAVNMPAALLTAYLVVTALTTVRRPSFDTRWLDIGAMLVAFGVGLTASTFGFEALANGGTRDGMPAFPFFLFGVIGLLGGLLDLRMIRSGPLRGASRLVRHLWRMSTALLIAALSFFLGQAKVIPAPIRIPVLLALPILAVFATMVYWLWRQRAYHRRHHERRR